MLIFWASFILVPLALLGFTLPIKKSLLVSMFLSLLLLITFVKNEVSPIVVSLCLIVLNLTPVFCAKLTNDLKRRKEIIGQKLKEATEGYTDLLNQQDKTKEQNLGLEQGLNELISLYEVTKQMNAARHYTELFEVFNQALRVHLGFGTGYLSLVEEKDGRFLNKKHFILELSGQIASPGQDITKEEKFINKVLKTVIDKKELFFKHPQIRRLLGDIELEDALGTLSVVPIGLDSSTPAVFIGKNLSEEDFGKLLILTRQLSMEMQRVSLYEKVQELAITDGLTGLFVRRRLMERMKEELERSLRYKLRLSVLMLDIDHFKEYNDRYGHLVGDVILKETAAIIRNSLSEVDLAGRYGGEEFCIILPETDKKGGLQVSERIRWAVDNHSFKAYDEVTNVTVSIGVATFPDDGMLMEELINNADKALYQAKRTGRNRVCAYTESLG